MVVVAPKAAQNMVVRLVLLDLALSFAQTHNLKFKPSIGRKWSKSNDARVVYVRPRVVVAPKAAQSKVVRLVLLNLALSFAQTHNSAFFGRRPP